MVAPRTAKTKARNRPSGRLWNMEELPSGGKQPSLSVAYLVLTGTSGWAIKQTAGATKFALGAFSFLLGHSIIGFYYSTHPEPPEVVGSIFRQTTILAEVAPLALLNTELFLAGDFPAPCAYFHLVTMLVPGLVDVFAEEYGRNALDVMVLGNIASLLILHVKKESGPWTAGLVTLGLLNHLIFKQVCNKYDVPMAEIVTIGLSFFNIFALGCLAAIK